ncbi:hypothetical protein AB0C70_28960 [Streptomyces sp. NPDC048564]|uniref:hypothetical protein n=1 Tax=Streptomyces sp. NPDC048564 TaxID=3155760 RepID=UPI003440133E
MRHPYDLWRVRYTPHERRYTGGHVIVLKALFDELTEAKALHRLGDPEWLGTAVAKLSSYTSWYAPRGSRRWRRPSGIWVSERPPGGRACCVRVSGVLARGV